MGFKLNITTLICCLISFSLKAQLFPNTSFENGGAECLCANGYLCGQNASRVVDGREPLFKKEYTTGCHDKNAAGIVDGFGSTSPLGAHSGTSSMHFYAGADWVRTTSINLPQCELIEICVWYAAPPASELQSDQNGSEAYCMIGVDNLYTSPSTYKQGSPRQAIPGGTVWTQYCQTFAVSAGTHHFGVSSGGGGSYTLWVDDFTVNYVDPKVDLIKNGTNDTILCNSETLTLNAAAASSPIDPYLPRSFLWSDNSTDSVITITSPGTYWVKMTLGCEETTDTIEVIYDKPIIDLGNDTTICDNETLILDVTTTNSSSYLWQDNSSDSTFNINQAGNFWVEVTNANNCIASDTINITTYTAPIFNLGKDTTLCPDDSLTLDVTLANTISYLWNDNSIDSTLTVSQKGQYFAEITDSNNCVASDTILIHVDFSSNFIDLGNDTTLCQDEILTLDVTIPETSYLWQDNSTNPIYLIQENGTYWVKATNQCGMYSDTIVTKFENCDCFFNIPNSFTPNSDNFNDEFFPKFDCEFSNYRFQVFNRWGELIFQTNIPKNSWDGTYKEQLCPTGVYVYFIQYEYETVFTKRHGIVNLIK